MEYNLRKKKQQSEKISNFLKRKRYKKKSSYEPQKKRVKFSSDYESDYESQSESEFDLNSEDYQSESDSEPQSESEDYGLDEYFRLDSKPLAEVILGKLRQMFPDLSSDELQTAVNMALAKARDNLIEDYSGAVPKDERWKVGIDDEKLEKLEPQLKAIRKMIEEEKPTISKILQSKLMSSEEKEALHIYDILENTEPYTWEHLHTRNELLKIIRGGEAGDETKDILEKYEKEEKKLQKNAGNPVSRLKKKILSLNASDLVKTRIYELYLQMEALPHSSDQKASLRSKILWATSLPHRNIVLPEVRLKNATIVEKARYCQQVYTTLDSKLYGMKEVKERLICILNNRLNNPQSKSMLALEGVPGVGKTAVAKALAESVGLPFEKIALGGLEDPGMLTGQDNSWIGSSPSILLQILKRMQCCNGIVLFDEVDKLSTSSRGKAVQNVLLHITDYTQNKEFQDSYLYEFPHDLSQIWFVFAMNDRKIIEPVLRDRLDIVKLETYTHEEKIAIINLHILPNTVADVGLAKDSIVITEQACNTLLSLLEPQLRDTGLRAIEKELHHIVSKINLYSTIKSGDNTMKLTYKLPKFNGFPHKITSSEIHDLWSKPKLNSGYLHMFG